MAYNSYFVHESIWAGLSVEDSASAKVPKGCDPTAGGWNQLEAHSLALSLTPVVDAGYQQDLYVATWLPHGGWLQAWAHPRKPKWKLRFPKAKTHRLVQCHFHSFLFVKTSQMKGRWI